MQRPYLQLRQKLNKIWTFFDKFTKADQADSLQKDISDFKFKTGKNSKLFLELEMEKINSKIDVDVHDT